MLTLPDAIVALLVPFATLFTSPTWRKAQLLLVGAILTPGQRTVAAALRVMGRSDQRDYAPLPRGAQSGGVVVPPGSAHPAGAVAPAPGWWRRPTDLGIDETLERRRGAKIRARAIYRPAGLRWSRPAACAGSP